MTCFPVVKLGNQQEQWSNTRSPPGISAASPSFQPPVFFFRACPSLLFLFCFTGFQYCREPEPCRAAACVHCPGCAAADSRVIIVWLRCSSAPSSRSCSCPDAAAAHYLSARAPTCDIQIGKSKLSLSSRNRVCCCQWAVLDCASGAGSQCCAGQEPRGRLRVADSRETAGDAVSDPRIWRHVLPGWRLRCL